MHAEHLPLFAIQGRRTRESRAWHVNGSRNTEYRVQYRHPLILDPKRIRMVMYGVPTETFCHRTVAIPLSVPYQCRISAESQCRAPPKTTADGPSPAEATVRCTVWPPRLPKSGKNNARAESPSKALQMALKLTAQGQAPSPSREAVMHRPSPRFQTNTLNFFLFFFGDGYERRPPPTFFSLWLAFLSPTTWSLLGKT
ncbi:hypothetical protein V8C37DRAFT_178817 [Trichoderma ceciliae]